MTSRRGFSLVEVGVSAVVLGVCAVMLSSVMGGANAQKHSTRRLALARSLVLRQLELIQERIDAGAAAPTTLDAMRGSGRAVTLALNATSDNLHGAEKLDYEGPIGTPGPGGLPGFPIPPAHPYHVLSPGVLTPLELERVGPTGERIEVQTFVSAVNCEGFTREFRPVVRNPLPAQYRDLDLIMVTAYAFDTLDQAVPRQMLAMTRLYRVHEAIARGGIYADGTW